jgi:protein SCO1/2
VTRLVRIGAQFAVAVSVLAAAPIVSAAGRTEPLPEELEGVGIDERLDEALPLDVQLVDEHGRRVRLGDFFDGERPVVLTLGYYRCPMLCNLVLNGFITTLRELEWTAGDEFDIVTVSINPNETPELAGNKKRNFLAAYGRAPAERGWHFMTASPSSIERLADAVGFRYKRVEGSDEYAHPAVVMLITPDGRVARYLYGVKYDAETLRLSLVEASDGRIGSTLDKVLLYCFHYDAVAGAYAPAATNLMRAGGVLTITLLGILLAVLWRRELRRSRTAHVGTA